MSEASCLARRSTGCCGWGGMHPSQGRKPGCCCPAPAPPRARRPFRPGAPTWRSSSGQRSGYMSTCDPSCSSARSCIASACPSFLAMNSRRLFQRICTGTGVGMGAGWTRDGQARQTPPPARQPSTPPFRGMPRQCSASHLPARTRAERPDAERLALEGREPALQQHCVARQVRGRGRGRRQAGAPTHAQFQPHHAAAWDGACLVGGKRGGAPLALSHSHAQPQSPATVLPP